MMGRWLIAIALAVSATLSPSGSGAQDRARDVVPEPSALIAQFAPATMAIELAGVEHGDGKVHAERAVFRGENVEIGVIGLDIREGEDGLLEVDADRVSFLPLDPEAARFSMNGLELSLIAAPIHAQDAFCAWVEVISNIGIQAFQMDRGDMNAAGVQVTARDISYGAVGQSSCAIEGRLDVGAATLRQGGDRMHSLNGLAAEAFLPGSPKAADSMRRPARLRIYIDDIEASKEGQIPSFGASDAEISLDADTNGLAEILEIVRSTDLTRSAAPAWTFMHAYNAVLSTSFDLGVRMPSLRIYSAGVVPDGLIRNFGRAGLSSMTGETSLEMSMRRGRGRLSQNVSLRGVVAEEFSADFRAAPYDQRIIAAAQAGIPLGFQMVPNISPGRIQIRIDDGGLSRAAREITGMPLSHYVGSSWLRVLTGNVTGPQQTEIILKAVTDFLDRFRIGSSLQLIVIPRKNENLLELAATLLSRPGDFPIEMIETDSRDMSNKP